MVSIYKVGGLLAAPHSVGPMIDVKSPSRNFRAAALDFRPETYDKVFTTTTTRHRETILETTKGNMETDGQSHASVHGHSRHMRMASVIAIVIAHAKGQSEIQVRDVVAGIYTANFERIVRFWPDAAAFEDFIAEHCALERKQANDVGQMDV